MKPKYLGLGNYFQHCRINWQRLLVFLVLIVSPESRKKSRRKKKESSSFDFNCQSECGKYDEDDKVTWSNDLLLLNVRLFSNLFEGGDESPSRLFCNGRKWKMPKGICNQKRKDKKTTEFWDKNSWWTSSQKTHAVDGLNICEGQSVWGDSHQQWVCPDSGTLLLWRRHAVREDDHGGGEECSQQNKSKKQSRKFLAIYSSVLGRRWRWRCRESLYWNDKNWIFEEGTWSL